MRKTMVLMTIGGWLLTGAAVAVDGGEKDSSSAGTPDLLTYPNFSIA